MRQAAAVIADALLLVLTVLIVGIIITGGGIVTVVGQRISVMGVDNPLIALTLLAILRYAMLPGVPLSGTARWPSANVQSGARMVLAWLHRRIESMPRRSAFTIVLCGAIAATVVKALLAAAYPGFFSGDDVEVHEMSIGALWHARWPIWDLRNALFPLGVVYPLQRLFAAAGAVDPSTLVFAGRLSVAVISSFTIVLLWRAAVRLWPGTPGWGIVAVLLFAFAHLPIAFGSSELPRPVATVLVVGAFVLLQDARALRVLGAGMLLGIAASLRFSEAVFLVPAAISLVWQRRWTPAVVLIASAIVTALVVVGLTDAWYWREPFHSVRAAIDYTLVQRLSSRGYQNVFWYLLHVFEWLSPAVAILAVLAFAASRRLTDVWMWAPVVLLSLLPHKEARYMIPVVPFACLMATRGLQVVSAAAAGDGRLRRTWGPIAVLGLLAIGLLHDAGHWRLPRSNADIAFARRLRDTLPSTARLSVEQAWRLGGRLYLHPREVLDLDPDRLGDTAYVTQTVPDGAIVVLDRRTADRHRLAETLASRGYERTTMAVDGSRYEMWTPRTAAAPAVR